MPYDLQELLGKIRKEPAKCGLFAGKQELLAIAKNVLRIKDVRSSWTKAKLCEAILNASPLEEPMDSLTQSMQELHVETLSHRDEEKAPDLTDAIRRQVLGQDLYESCRENGDRISVDDLRWRLKQLQEEGIFKDCDEQDIVRVCNFKETPKSTCGRSLFGANFESVNSCGICMIDKDEKGKYPTRTPCGHMYHRTCLDTWAKGGREFQCPSCRRMIYIVDGKFTLERPVAPSHAVQPEMDRNFIEIPYLFIQPQIRENAPNLRNNPTYQYIMNLKRSMVESRYGMSDASTYIESNMYQILHTDDFYTVLNTVESHQDEMRLGDLLTILILLSESGISPRFHFFICMCLRTITLAPLFRDIPADDRLKQLIMTILVSFVDLNLTTDTYPRDAGYFFFSFFQFFSARYNEDYVRCISEAYREVFRMYAETRNFSKIRLLIRHSTIDNGEYDENQDTSDIATEVINNTFSDQQYRSHVLRRLRLEV